MGYSECDRCTNLDYPKIVGGESVARNPSKIEHFGHSIFPKRHVLELKCDSSNPHSICWIHGFCPSNILGDIEGCLEHIYVSNDWPKALKRI